ncbi:hypothetical protein MXD61_15720 [Frankia sp. AgPm24]|nr:hypothetical protein [Frankia sp. AgPm24]
MTPKPTRPRIARVFTTIDGLPSFESHERVKDSVEKSRILAYLSAGELLLRTTGFTRDVTDTGKGDVVPMSFRTDGSWVWNDAVIYYLDSYDIGPQAELLTHIRGRGHTFTAPTDEQISAAQDVLQERIESSQQR